ncbi:MAG TPA: hypothetical protein DD979_04410 [Gammaproteobacteria bacterium]|nr:hypothetical protein [Gammaproteobacteria bacterium]
MNISVEFLQRLSQIGYAACFKDQGDRGEFILDAVYGLKPGQEPTLVGKAVGKIAVRKFDEAIDLLQNRVLTENPDNLTAKCFLGLALSETGSQSEAEDHLEEVMMLGNDDHRAVASAVLGA